MGQKKEELYKPKISDFSQEATNRAVLNMTLQNPVTLYPTAIGILSAITLLLFSPSLVTYGLTILGGVLGIGSWCVNFFLRYEYWRSKYLNKLQKALDLHEKKIQEELRQELLESEKIEDAKHFILQGSEQVNKIKSKFENFENILTSKLDPHEITFDRFLGTSKQVYISVLNNLHEANTRLKTIQEIDLTYIENRLKQLSQLESLAAADIQEKKTLETRFELRKKQMDQVNVILTKNEEAMTLLDQTTAALVDIKVTNTGNLDSAIADLEEIASRIDEYSE